ncbi:MAG: Gfo/Idh/MocA family oxidoreductase [Bryobacteraceae bacterium]
MERKWKGALIGCGYFGKIQAEAWGRMEDVEIVAACDADVVRARAVAAHAYESAGELLGAEENLDFVDIATRPDSHLDLVRLTAARGIPTICQKPMAQSVAEAIELSNLPTRLMIHENWRWQPWFRAAKVMIDAGTIGRPVGYYFRTRQRDGLGPCPYPNQPYFREMPRLLIHETLIHHVDTARFFFGNIRSVYAHARRHNSKIQGEDRALLTLVHYNDVDGLIDGHRFLNPEPAGAAMGDAWLDGEDAALHINAAGDISIKGEQVWKAPPPEGYKGDSVFATQRHFIDCLASGAPFETSAQEYLASFAASEAAYLSVAEHREISMAELMPK